MDITRHKGYYISLVTILAISGYLILAAASDRKLQILTVITAAFFYIIFGIVHHLVNHDLKPKIVIEYILIGALGATVVLFVLNLV